MKDTRIKQILTKLMADKKIRVAELARLIKLPQPTVHRIVTGTCENPHISSLKPLANFFSINIDQLKGLEPIPWLDHATKVPVLTWDEIIHWETKNQIDNKKEYILTDAMVSHRGVALKVKDSSMDPLFPPKTILITDPEKIPKDRSFVIAKLFDYPEAIFRQLLIDAGNYYLKPLSPDFEQYKMKRLHAEDKILCVVVQAKRNYED